MSNPKSFHTHPFGVVRREFLQVGFSGFLGVGLPTLAKANAGTKPKTSRTRPRAKSMIVVFLTGGLSHLDSFDMKPNAPDGIRGEFKPIDTAAPGVSLCEHLPEMAARMDQFALVRSLSHGHTNHLNATHQILTGHKQPGAFFDKIASRDDFPCHAAGLDYVRPRQDGVPTGVMLPTFLMEGPLTWPGQHAGFLGPKHDPWQIRQDPNRSDFKVEELALPVGFSVERLGRRRELLTDLGSLGERDGFADRMEAASSLLMSAKVARAFEIEREDPRVRDKYGRHMYGQSLLLARRLVEAGVSVIQVNMGRVQTWDTHNANFRTLKTRLLPPTDRGVSALIDDLASSGLLDETLVVVTGEFGRTPRIGSTTGNANSRDGRDHWSAVFSAAFAGAGVQGGTVVGQSDKNGAYPSGKGYTPGDLAATIYQALGVDHDVEIRDRLNRPNRLCDGRPIAGLFDSTLA